MTVLALCGVCRVYCGLIDWLINMFFNCSCTHSYKYVLGNCWDHAPFRWKKEISMPSRRWQSSCEEAGSQKGGLALPDGRKRVAGCPIRSQSGLGGLSRTGQAIGPKASWGTRMCKDQEAGSAAVERVAPSSRQSKGFACCVEDKLSLSQCSRSRNTAPRPKMNISVESFSAALTWILNLSL